MSDETTPPPAPLSTEPLYNAVPVASLYYASFDGQLWPRMEAHRSQTMVWVLEQTSEAELAEYGETPAYLDANWGIGTRIARVARLVLGREVLYACDQHPGASHCEHAGLLEDAIAKGRAARQR